MGHLLSSTAALACSTADALTSASDCSCTGLVRVSFHINVLTSIPHTVGQLTALEAGTWHRNHITELPAEIGGLTRVRELALFENCLRALPNTIGNLKSCTELWVYGNELQELPESIDGLVALRCAVVPRGVPRGFTCAVEGLG